MGCGGSKKSSDVMVPGDLENSHPEELNMTEVKARVNELYQTKNENNEILLEKVGLDAMLNLCRDELSDLATQQQKSRDNYEFLLRYAMERDADDVYRALQSSQIDKRVIIDILTARTKWQLDQISDIFQKKHNVPLISEIQKRLTKSLTGSQSDLGKLLLYVCMEQPERDSYLLQHQIKDMGIIIEVSSFFSDSSLLP
jgi:hypothetical protein